MPFDLFDDNGEPDHEFPDTLEEMREEWRERRREMEEQFEDPMADALNTALNDEEQEGDAEPTVDEPEHNATEARTTVDYTYETITMEPPAHREPPSNAYEEDKRKLDI